MRKGSIKLGNAKKVCYFPRFTNKRRRTYKKIQWLVTYTWVQMCNLKLSRPQNKPDKHN